MHSPSRLASNREARSWTVLFFTWSHPVWRLSWTASLPSWNALTHRATVRDGNSSSSYASCSPWKHSCILWPHATLILLQELCSSFVNMALRHSHYPFESQHFTHCHWKAAVTHLTVLLQVHKAGSSRAQHHLVPAVLPVLFYPAFVLFFVQISITSCSSYELHFSSSYFAFICSSYIYIYIYIKQNISNKNLWVHTLL